MPNRLKKNKSDDCIVTRELPHKIAEEYIASLHAMKDAQKNWDQDNSKNAPDQELLREQNKFLYNEERLKKTRENYFKTKEILHQQWEELMEKELALRENFIKFNMFVRQNIEKRERAGTKCSEQRELRDERQADISNLKEKIEAVKKAQARTDYNIITHKIYEDYLDEVVADDSEFKTLNDILKRHECLEETKNYLGAKQQQSMLALEIAQLELGKFVEKAELVLVGLHTKIYDLNDRYSKAYHNSIHWENIVNSVRDALVVKLRDIYCIKEVCWICYLKMSERKMSNVNIPKNDVEKQLIFIKKTLLDIKRIATVLAKKNRKEYVLTSKNKSSILK